MTWLATMREAVRARAWLRAGLWSAAVLTALWVLAPRPSAAHRDDAVEIAFMSPSGPLSGSLEDAVREFERLSAERHRADPSYPIYRVVAGTHPGTRPRTPRAFSSASRAACRRT